MEEQTKSQKGIITCGNKKSYNQSMSMGFKIKQ